MTIENRNQRIKESQKEFETKDETKMPLIIDEMEVLNTCFFD